MGRTTIAIVTTVLMLAAGPGCRRDIRERDVRTVPVVEARRLSHQQGAVVLDARSANAYGAGHIPGAQNVRIDGVAADGPKRSEWAKAAAIVVYGEDASSAAARALARRLMEVGYERVRVLEGGIRGWREFGLPVEEGSE